MQYWRVREVNLPPRGLNLICLNHSKVQTMLLEWKIMKGHVRTMRHYCTSIGLVTKESLHAIHAAALWTHQILDNGLMPT